MQTTSVISVSPSFTAHSSNNLADIAARVVQEFRNENGHDDIYDDFTDDGNQFYVPADDENLKENEADEDEDGEFEFDVVRIQSHSSPVSADEIFSNGEILPRYPLFDRSLLLDDDDVPNFYKIDGKSDANKSKPSSPVVRVPLRKLFSEERDSPSCSSSEADDLDGITPGTYCIWKPKAESPERCKKSNSTGNTSKRWRFRNLLHRSNSDNNFSSSKDASVVVFSPVTATKKRSEKVKKVEKTSKVAVADGDDDGEITTTTVTIENNPANKMNKGDLQNAVAGKFTGGGGDAWCFVMGPEMALEEKLKGFLQNKNTIPSFDISITSPPPSPWLHPSRLESRFHRFMLRSISAPTNAGKLHFFDRFLLLRTLLHFFDRFMLLQTLK
ncbi:hypothetical protein L6452_39629 [Arctium lappa]|uniref:Uncharacterized protein n=1 Tax=Arctium lappa TaxID=4217 RepID=A0ACB8XS72_ARCLA|nr:hypothetical protein L6452_39629 [Arctium lappa]